MPLARFEPADDAGPGKPVLLALGGLDGTGRVGALNWRRLREWFDVRTLVLDPQDRSSRASRVGSLGRVAE